MREVTPADDRNLGPSTSVYFFAWDGKALTGGHQYQSYTYAEGRLIFPNDKGGKPGCVATEYFVDTGGDGYDTTDTFCWKNGAVVLEGFDSR